MSSKLRAENDLVEVGEKIPIQNWGRGISGFSEHNGRWGGGGLLKTNSMIGKKRFPTRSILKSDGGRGLLKAIYALWGVWGYTALRKVGI